VVTKFDRSINPLHLPEICTSSPTVGRLPAMVASPFQRLCCVQPTNSSTPVLTAASGSLISSFDLRDGSLIARWPRTERALPLDGTDAEGEDRPPSKKRKLDEEPNLSREASDESLEIISERRKGERRRPKVESTAQANVSHLIATSDGKHVVCVTAEDKSIKVFNVEDCRVLKLMTERYTCYQLYSTSS
jgi:tRNA (guanine-N(7)-)-methyltransferase subunit TRM82